MVRTRERETRNNRKSLAALRRDAEPERLTGASLMLRIRGIWTCCGVLLCLLFFSH